MDMEQDPPTEDLSTLQEQVREFLQATNNNQNEFGRDIYDQQQDEEEGDQSLDNTANTNGDDLNNTTYNSDTSTIDTTQYNNTNIYNHNISGNLSMDDDGLQDSSKTAKRNRRKFAINNSSDVMSPPPGYTSPFSVGSGGTNSVDQLTPIKNSLSPSISLSPSQPLSPSTSNSSTVYGGAKPHVVPFSTFTSVTSNDQLNQNNSNFKTIGKYQIVHHIGNGCFGNTYSAVPPDSSEYVVIKLIDINRVNLNQQNIIKKEYEILKTLSHQNIVNYESLISNNNNNNNNNDQLAIVQEFVENGSLFDIYKRLGAFPESLLVKYVTQTLDCLIYIHSQQIIHKNIKANNILLGKGGKCKLSDFGLGCTLGNNYKNTIFGEPYWSAPELLLMKDYNTKIDIWSIGCTIIELITGKPPYYEKTPMEALISIIDTNQSIEIPTNVSKDLESFLQQCLIKDPVHRPTIETLLKHPWIVSQGSSQSDSGTFTSLLNQGPIVNNKYNNNNHHMSQQPNRSENFSIDFLSQIEINQHDIETLQPMDINTIQSLDTLLLQEFKEIDKSNTNNNNQNIEINQYNLDLGDKFKEALGHLIQDQFNSYNLTVKMHTKMQEILDQNKTGARITAHSNMLLKRTNQMASELTKKNEYFKHNIKRLEDYLLTKDDCAKKLANVVYKHKTQFDHLLNPTLAAPVVYQVGSKLWKKGQEKRALCVLKDNFLFFFKNDKSVKSSYPLDIVYMNDKKSISVSSSQDSNKKKTFFISIGTSISSGEHESNDNQTTSTTASSSSTVSGSSLSINHTNQSSNSSNSNNNSNNTSGGTLTNSHSGSTLNVSTISASLVTTVPSSGGSGSGSGSTSTNNSTTLWCLLAFDNQKDQENWFGLIEACVPWYERKPNEISKPLIETSKKHTKSKSQDTKSKSGITSVEVEPTQAEKWKRDGKDGKFPGVFGVPLEEVMSRENPNAEIPSFITKMVNFLERNIQEEGLLRMSGSTSEIQEMKATLQKGENIDYPAHRDAHAVAGLLKLYLRELPDSLFPISLRLVSSEIIADRAMTETDKIIHVIDLFRQIPKHDYNLLKYMIRFAKRVTEQSEHNKMVLSNVTTCFAQSLKGLIPGLFTFCVTNYDQIFTNPIKYNSQ